MYVSRASGTLTLHTEKGSLAIEIATGQVDGLASVGSYIGKKIDELLAPLLEEGRALERADREEAEKAAAAAKEKAKAEEEAARKAAAAPAGPLKPRRGRPRKADSE